MIDSFKLKDFYELIESWFNIKKSRKDDYDGKDEVIGEYVDNSKKRILFMLYQQSESETEMIEEVLKKYDGKMTISGVFNKEHSMVSIKISFIEDEDIITRTYLLENMYVIEKLLIDVVKKQKPMSVKNIIKTMNIEALKNHYAKTIVSLADWYYPMLDKYFDDPMMAIEYGRERLIYGVVQQYPICQRSKDYLIDILLRWKLEPIDIQGMIDDRIHNEISKYHYLVSENTEYHTYIALTPDVLGDLVQELLNHRIKKAKGIYYSPKSLVSYICNNTILQYISDTADVSEWMIGYLGGEDAKCDLTQREIELEAKRAIDALMSIKIAEPSVGCGEFIMGAVNKLLGFHIKLNQLLSIELKGKPYSDLILHTINNCLYAVDIERSALLITKFRLFILIYRYMNCDGDILGELSMNIRLGDSLYKDEYNGFDWYEDFPEVFVNGGFDIVIGNPPYVGEKGNKELFRRITQSDFGSKFYQGKMDLFYFFFHKSIDITKPGGVISFITTNYYVTANGGNKLRDDIRERTVPLKFINFNEIKLFDMARGQHDLITILKKEGLTDDSLTEIYDCRGTGTISRTRLANILGKRDKESSYFTVKSKELFDNHNGHIRITSSHDDILSMVLEKMEGFRRLDEYFNINQGIVSGADKLSNRHLNKYGIEGIKGQGIFVLNDDEIKEMKLNDLELSKLKPFYKNSDIDKYNTQSYTDKHIIYFDREIKDITKDYPALSNHLLKYQPILADRREVIRGYIEYFHLQWSRNIKIFTSEKVVAPQRSSRNVFAYNDIDWFASADVYYITKRDDYQDENLRYLTAIMNSKLYYLWLYYRGKKKGNILELYQTPLKEVPYIIDDSMQGKILEYADKLISRDEVEYQEAVDDILFKHLEVEGNERIHIENMLNKNKIV